MERNKTMVTLAPVRGKESELEKMINRFANVLETKGERIIKGETKIIHYHVIGEDLKQIIKKMKEWPGIKIKEHRISESQAQEMQHDHILYDYSEDGGLQHEGSNSTSMKSYPSSGDAIITRKDFS